METISRDRHEMKQEYKFIYFEGCYRNLQYFRDFICAAYMMLALKNQTV